ncbi:MAG: hypothetical protein PHX27_02860 [Candidatus ainarchaeum sp.]|nr:hypothetical protein [Candidatus ainarchaeum sp.]
MKKRFEFGINKKGFIGSIGDDLPSLMPIIVALLLFFTIFSITLSSYTEKNVLLKKNISLMNISREIKGDSLITSVDAFSNNCNRIKFNQYSENFMIAIYSNETITKMFANGKSFLDDFKEVDAENPESSDNFLTAINNKGDEEAYFCYYQKIGGKQITNNKINYVTRFYPVAVQTKVDIAGKEYLIILPGLMVMVIW